jgi:ribosomal protein S27AE
MVLEPKQTTVAYRCPHCGAGVISAVDLFKLSADMVKLKCSCGESEMTIVYKKDGKIRFTVPCILCPTPHNFSISSTIFFGKDLFVLPCPYSDINICMMGDTNHVKAELSRTELELLDILEKSGLENFDDLKGEQFPTDPQITEIVTYIIKELDAEGKIKCHCTDEEECEYDAEIQKDGVTVRCTRCNASKFIATDSLISAHEFLNADSIELE